MAASFCLITSHHVSILHQQKIEQDLLNSRIVALFLESVLWGVFAVLYTVGDIGLLSGNQPYTLSRREKCSFGVNTLMFVLATTVRRASMAVLRLTRGMF